MAIMNVMTARSCLKAASRYSGSQGPCAGNDPCEVIGRQRVLADSKSFEQRVPGSEHFSLSFR